MAVNLSTEAFGKVFSNPILCASGTFGYGKEFADLIPLNALGGLVTKGISFLPRPGNPPPRICETTAGMLNSIGLENVGIENFIYEKLPFLRDCGTRVVVNVFGATTNDYIKCVERLSIQQGIDALEINISCPNVEAGGLEFGTQPDMAGELVKQICANTGLPVIVKLTPNVTDIVPIARACVEAGCSGLSLINTPKGMAIDAKSRRPKLARIIGGLSGPAIKPIALRFVYQLAQAQLGVPIIGIGGICSGEDVVEFLLAGATLVQIGTANFLRPNAALIILQEFEAFCQTENIHDVRELIGGLLMHPR